MYYIIDKNNKVVASCHELPDMDDLASREERILLHDSNFPAGSALVLNGQIQHKPATPPSQKDIEMKKIYSRMFKKTAAELQAEGEITDPDLVDYKDSVEKEKANNGKK